MGHSLQIMHVRVTISIVKSQAHAFEFNQFNICFFFYIYSFYLFHCNNVFLQGFESGSSIILSIGGLARI